MKGKMYKITPDDSIVPISSTNALPEVFVVHVYAADGGIVGLGEGYHPNREAAEAFARNVANELPRYRCRIAEYKLVSTSEPCCVSVPVVI